MDFLCVQFDFTIYLFFLIWKKAWPAARLERAYQIFCLLTVVAIVPMYVVHNDWGRWLGAIILTQFILIMSLSSMHGNAMQKSLVWANQAIVQRPLLNMGVLVTCALLPRFDTLLHRYL